MKQRSFVPGLGFAFLTPVYDLFLAVTMREATLRATLLEQVDLRQARTVVDVGCGTGTQTILLKQDAPHARVFGVDVDPAMIARAKVKSRAAGVDVAFELAEAGALPFADHSIDVVVSTLVFHHLLGHEKKRALAEIRRVLKPEGQFHLVDFGRPANPLNSLIFNVLRRFDGKANTETNAAGALPELVKMSGFPDTRMVSRMDTILGTVDFIVASR
jgi:ubiquinone/menaquinone biosynthesis C-methylase UbiE